MKTFIKSFIVSGIFFYFCFAFINADFNAFNWSADTRAGLIILWALIGGAMALFTTAVEEEEL
jgi:uncharacterized integral membrane protein